MGRKRKNNLPIIETAPQKFTLKLRGRFVVFEGADGAGKDTQVGLLMQALDQAGVKYKMLHFPRYTENEYGRLITRYLKGDFGGLYEVSPYLASLPYASDRLLAKPQIEKWMDEQYLVIANRYITSNLAHMSAKLPPEDRQQFLDWLASLEFNINRIPKPDLSVFLSVPVGQAQKNLGRRGNIVDLGGKKLDIHEVDLDYQQAVNNVYLNIAQNDPSWEIIECLNGENMRTREEIHQQILQILVTNGILV